MPALADVPGIRLGHDSAGDTGVTVVVAEAGAIGAVDVRGGGPGTRETDLLAPHNTVERVHAVTLTGGSAFGLAAADGVMRTLESNDIGFPVFGPDQPGPLVPIVPAAVIFDLDVGDPSHRPTADHGSRATETALAAPGASASAGSGSVGAGCGATAGRLRGGFGQAGLQVGQYHVAAGVVANPVGEVIDERTGLLYGDPSLPAVDTGEFARLAAATPKLNTTIGVIATDAPLTKPQANRLATTGHDGIARAVRPAHLPMDGDTLFTLATGDGSGVAVPLLAELAAAAASCVEAAIVDAVTHAEPGAGTRSWRELRVQKTDGRS